LISRKWLKIRLKKKNAKFCQFSNAHNSFIIAIFAVLTFLGLKLEQSGIKKGALSNGAIRFQIGEKKKIQNFQKKHIGSISILPIKN